MPIVQAINPSNVEQPLLVDANGNVLVSASELTTTGGKVNVDASGNVIVSANQLTSTGAKIQLESDGKLKSANYGYQGGVFHKSPIAFGASAVKFDNVQNTSIAAGTSQQAGGTVPVGEYWVITNITMVCSVALPAGNLTAQSVLGGTGINLWRINKPAASIIYDKQGQWLLFAGDRLNYQIVGGIAGSIFIGSACGYRVDIDL